VGICAKDFVVLEMNEKKYTSNIIYKIMRIFRFVCSRVVKLLCF
jgi:hypothetical protein